MAGATKKGFRKSQARATHVCDWIGGEWNVHTQARVAEGKAPVRAGCLTVRWRAWLACWQRAAQSRSSQPSAAASRGWCESVGGEECMTKGER
jgi:hypothetical protein